MGEGGGGGWAGVVLKELDTLEGPSEGKLTDIRSAL